MAASVFHPIAQTTMVYLRYLQGSNHMENTFAYRWNSATVPSAAELLTLCQEVGSTIGAKLQAMTVNTVQLIEVHARNMNVALGLEATAPFTTGTQGQLNGTPYAANCTGNLVTRVGLAGYGMHGGKRFGCWTNFEANGNSIASLQMTRFANMALSVIATRVGGRFIPAVPHLSGVSANTSTLITSVLMLDSDIDSQKTRLNNHGT